MSKTIQLTIGERVAALRLFDEFKGSVTELAAVMDDVKNTVITKEEWTAANRVVTPNTAGTGEKWEWNEADETTWKTIEFADASAAYLVRAIADKSSKGEVTIGDAALINLNKKLA